MAALGQGTEAIEAAEQAAGIASRIGHAEWTAAANRGLGIACEAPGLPGPAEFSRLAATHLGTRKDVVAAPLMHDTPDELAQPGGQARDWKAGDCRPVPGVTMPRLVTVERDYPAVADKMAALGPLTGTLGSSVKGVTWVPAGAVDYLRRANGTVRGGVADGRPALVRDLSRGEASVTAGLAQQRSQSAELTGAATRWAATRGL